MEQELLLYFHDHFDFFLKRKNTSPVRYSLTRKASIKDIIESLGIPHTEVGSIRTGIEEKSFDWIPDRSETVSIHPLSPPVDVTLESYLRPTPLPGLSFIVDENVGKLAGLLRILGIDTLYYSGIRDHDIAEAAHRLNRVVLSKDTQLFKRRLINYGRYIRSVHPYDQLKEVVGFFGLQPPFSGFSRCLVCNEPLTYINKHDILHRLEPKTKQYYDTFKYCRVCDRVVWKGSHCDTITKNMQAIGIRL